MTSFHKAAAILAFALTACGDQGRQSDAYGNFEATEIVVSSETTGRLLDFRAEEGRRLPGGAVAAVVDTTLLVLERSALQARREAAASRIENVRAQLGVLEEKQRIAAREQTRFENLVRQDAAPSRQVDEAADQFRVLEREMATVRSQFRTIRGEVETIEASINQINDRIARSVVRNPVDGIVLTTYAQPHELAAPGRPLYEIASLDTLYLKAFVSGGQLPRVRLGQRVEVVVDESAGSVRNIPGTVSWIASEAEFTPKLIQTREERVHLVYAVKIRVPNPDGSLKIGMPGEVILPKE